MDKILEVFPDKTLQGTFNVFYTLEEHGKTVEEFREWYIDKKEKQRLTQKKFEESRQKYLAKSPKCPDCREIMTLQSVDEESCQWECFKCKKGIPVYHSAKQEMKERMSN